MTFLVDRAVDAIKAKLQEVEKEKDLLVKRIEAQADAFKAEKMKMLDEFAEEKKKWLLRGFIEKYNSIFEYIMNIVVVTIKEKVDDPYMPRFFKGWIDSIIDAMWPDVKSEVRDTLLTEFAEHHDLHHGEPPCCGCGWSPLSFVRYHLFPYDRNIWRQIRDPFWWLCFLISIVPVYGIAQIYYMLLFTLLDHRDCFQMHQFVTNFKYLQFLSLGVLSAIIGSAQYYICTSQSPSTCEANAPRTEVWLMIVFVLQVIVAWTAFLLERCAFSKGGMHHQLAHLKEHERMSRRERREGFANALKGEAVHGLAHSQKEQDEKIVEDARRRLLKLLIYDLVIFGICVTLALIATFYNALDRDAEVTTNEHGATNDNWKYSATLFWIRAFYGLMSFPFALLKVPGLSVLFSHAKPTGYNPYGNTVTFLGKEEDGPVPWDPERPYADPEIQAAALDRRARERGEPIAP